MVDHKEQDDRDREHGPISLVPEDAPHSVETRDPASRPIPSRSRVWLFALPPLALIVVGLAWMFSVERGTQAGVAREGLTGTTGSQPDPNEGSYGESLNPAPEGPPIIGTMELLTAKADYVGRPVEIRAIPVSTRTGPRTFWAGRLANRTLVLRDAEAEGLTDVQPGQIVRLSGRLEEAPEGEALDRLGLDEADRGALDGVDVFIRATAVLPQDEAAPLQTPTR